VTDEPQPPGDASTNGWLPLASVGGVVAVAGFALLAIEAIRTLTGGVLGSLGTILLWVGVGVLAVGLLLLVMSLAGGDETPAWGAQPLSDVEPIAAPPVEPAPAPAAAPPPVAAPPVAASPPPPAAEAPAAPVVAPAAEPPAAPAAPIEPPAAAPGPPPPSSPEAPPSADGS
jgi:hypothetical protein